MKKSQPRTRIVLLVFALLLIGAGLPCFVRVRREQNQYALNRSLIEALKKGDGRQALVLVNAGADPNTRFKPIPTPSLSDLMNQWLRHAPPPANKSATALMLVCGAIMEVTKRHSDFTDLSDAEVSPLVQAMLVHGADPNGKDGKGWTALLWIVLVHRNKEIAQQLLTAGANPDSADIFGQTTPLMVAEGYHYPDLAALMRKYSKRR